MRWGRIFVHKKLISSKNSDGKKYLFEVNQTSKGVSDTKHIVFEKGLSEASIKITLFFMGAFI